MEVFRPAQLASSSELSFLKNTSSSLTPSPTRSGPETAERDTSWRRRRVRKDGIKAGSEEAAEEEEGDVVESEVCCVFVEGPAECSSPGAEAEAETSPKDGTERSDEEEAAAKEKALEEEALAMERKAQRQMMTIEELMDTERRYLRMLQLCTVTIRNSLQKLQPPLPNLASMFLYIEEVMEVSGRLLSLLDQKRVQPGDPLFLETLCNSFLSLSSDIESAYREYLANYSNVTSVENSYKQKEALWSHIISVIKSSAPEVNATSLSFFLVMPVQRIARYPLLLQTIQKHTDPSHPAYPLLEQTAHTSIALNCRINEYKRFREVADKYKKTETLSIKDKINRLTSHSIAKKTARLSQQIKHETGMAPKLVDEEFDALEDFFCVLEKGILDLHDNMEAFLLHLQRLLACRPEEFDLDMDGEKLPICYKEITTALRQWILPTFEKRLRSLIHKPLCVLRDLLAGPRNLIRKRVDKLLDYELIEARSSLSYEEQAVANTYKTINTLLLNELPQFNGLALQMIWSMLGTFSCLHRDLASEMEQLFQGFAQQLPHSSVGASAFWEWAECAVLERASRLESVCRNVEDRLNVPIVQPLSPSSQRRLKQLTQKHGSGKIYQVRGSVVGTRDLDLSLGRGELVAILSEADTRGDRRRWLVDAGGPRGYVPASKLVRYHQATTEPLPSPLLNVPVGPTKFRRHSYAPESQPIASFAPPLFLVYASYDFTARGSHEVSMRAGEWVRVLEPHDKRGNPEWSLVEAPGGHRGYVPSNYLALVASSPGPTAPHR